MNVWQKQTIRWVTNGKSVQRGTPHAKRVVILSKRFYGTLRTYLGKTKQVPLTEDKNTSQTLLRRLQTLEDEKRANGVDRFYDDRMRRISDHVDAYEIYLASKANTPLHVKTQASRIRRLITTTKAKTIADLDSTKILATLNVWRSRKRKSMSVQTSNHYMVAIKGFTRWLWQERKTPDDALAGLRRMNVNVDRRRVRRALTSDELQRLTTVTQLSKKTCFGPDWRLTPDDRAMIYTVAAFTGLRVSELATLRQSAFNLDAGTMTLEASNVKNRKRTTLPVSPALIVKLKAYFATLTHDIIWRGRWAANRRAGQIFKRDLKRASIAAVDADGKRVDFHSLRYSFITSLALAGVHPAKAQRLARHSDINLTMGVYTSLNVDDLRDAVNALK